MGARIRTVEYFNATVRDRPGEAYRLLAELAAAKVDLLAFSAVPIGPEYTQLVLFPDDSDRMIRTAAETGAELAGPQRALLVQGDDGFGALTGIHRRLFDAGVNLYASHGVTDGKGGFGYVLYIRPEHLDQAARALGC